MDANSVINLEEPFLEVIKEKEVDKIIFGLPYTLAGEIGPQGKKVKEIATDIANKLEIDYEFVDERNSSNEAKLYMRELGFNEKKMRGKIDMVAAQIFLQSYLDSVR